MVTILAPTALCPAVELPLYCFISPSFIRLRPVASPGRGGRWESQCWGLLIPWTGDEAVPGVCEAVAFILVKLSPFCSLLSYECPATYANTCAHTALHMPFYVNGEYLPVTKKLYLLNMLFSHFIRRTICVLLESTGWKFFEFQTQIQKPSY